MKIILSYIFLLFSQIAISQSEYRDQLFADILGNELMSYSGEVRFVEYSKVLLWDEKMKLLKDAPNNTFYKRDIWEIDSIVLSNDEINLIIGRFSDEQYLQPKRLPAELEFINHDSIIDFLKTNRESQVVYITEPVFLRNNSIALVFFYNFCCGGIYGPVHFSFYRQEDDAWKKWISISEGAF